MSGLPVDLKTQGIWAYLRFRDQTWGHQINLGVVALWEYGTWTVISRSDVNALLAIRPDIDESALQQSLDDMARLLQDSESVYHSYFAMVRWNHYVKGLLTFSTIKFFNAARYDGGIEAAAMEIAARALYGFAREMGLGVGEDINQDGDWGTP